MTDLTTWLLATASLPVSAIGGHGDWAATSCPGDALRPLIRDPDWLAAIAARLA